MLYQQVSQRAVVDIRTSDDAGRRERLLVPATVHNQWSPFGDLGATFGVLHSVVTMVCGHLPEALAQEGDIVLPPHEAHVRAGMDESVRVRDRPLSTGDEVDDLATNGASTPGPRIT